MKMVFGKRQKVRKWREKHQMKLRRGGGEKVQKYNGPEVVQHIETSIYRGGTTAQE